MHVGLSAWASMCVCVCWCEYDSMCEYESLLCVCVCVRVRACVRLNVTHARGGVGGGVECEL